MENETLKALIADEKDILALSRRLLRHSTSYLSLRGVIQCLRQIISEQHSLRYYHASDQAYPQKLSSIQDLRKKLRSLLTENYGLTWFTRVVDRNCSDDLKLKERLYQFIQRTIGPVINLSISIEDKRKYLVVAFPNSEIRNIFLKNLGIYQKRGVLVIHENQVFFPASLSENQRLVVTFPTVKIKESFIHLLNLTKTKLVSSSYNDCSLYVNDRRILDTASKFYFAIQCPYFNSYYQIRHASLMLAQGYRDRNSFFSMERFPIELTLKIASDVCSSDAMSPEEKMKTAESNFGWPI